MITEFNGKYRWLSNMWLCDVAYENIIYPSSEHGYVAAKTLKLEERLAILKIANPIDVKKFGRTLELRPNWDSIKVQEMFKIVFDKFTRNEELTIKLKDTGNQELIEGNWWGDKFWGESPLGFGENNLGKILMQVRELI